MITPPDDAFADLALARYLAAERAAPGPSLQELGAETVRRAQRERAVGRKPEPEIFAATDLSAGGVPARLYRPTETATGLLVFLHGGMWSIGSLDSHDRACRRLALTTGTCVLAVDYRLAPEHPLPAAVEDAVTAFDWAAANVAELTGGTGMPAIGGDSCGGHLATMTCLWLRDHDRPLPAAQFLITPNTDLTLSQPSTVSKATGWGLTTDAVAWGAQNWVPDPALRGDPRVSPLFADLTGLPPALVTTAEHDPLRDEGEAYADRLREAGVAVTSLYEPGMIHGYINLDTISPAAAAAGDRAFAAIRELLSTVLPLWSSLPQPVSYGQLREVLGPGTRGEEQGVNGRHLRFPDPHQGTTGQFRVAQIPRQHGDAAARHRRGRHRSQIRHHHGVSGRADRRTRCASITGRSSA